MTEMTTRLSQSLNGRMEASTRSNGTAEAIEHSTTICITVDANGSHQNPASANEHHRRSIDTQQARTPPTLDRHSRSLGTAPA